MERPVLARLLAGGLGALAVSAVLAAQALERVTYVTAVDHGSRAPVSELAAADIALLEDNVRREVLRIAPATSPMPIAVLVDNSQAAQETIANLRRALATFLRDIDGLGPVALISFADRPTILQDYTTSQDTLQDAASRIFAMPGSGATILDAIVETAQGLAKREADRAALVVISTDRAQDFSNWQFGNVLDILSASGASLNALVLNDPRRGLDSDQMRNRAIVLDRGTKESGGTRFDVLVSQAYEGELKKLAAMLKSQWRVTYARPQTLIPPKKLEVRSSRTGIDAWGAPARGQKER